MVEKRITEGLYQKIVLHNGIRIVTEKIPYLRSVSIGIWINSGSRDEEDKNSGISHFLEHLAFKGTEKRSARQIAFEMDSIGGQIDAFTSREYTCYSAKVLDEHLPVAIDLLSDILLNSTLKPADIDKERQVILEEVKFVEDNPADYIYDLLYQSVWSSHPLGRSILGNHESIERIDRNKLVNHLDNHYIPKNIIIAAAGNINEDRLKELLEKAFGSLNKNASSSREAPPEIKRNFIIKERELEQVHFCLGTKGLRSADENRFEGYLLNTILGGSMSSRLFQKIREDYGLAYSIHSFISPYADTGLLGIYAGTSAEFFEKVLKMSLEEFKLLMTVKVSGDELKKAKEQLKGNLMLSLESSSSRMNQLAKQEMYFERFFSMDEIIDEIEKVTEEKIQRLANRLFDNSFLNLAVLGPVKKEKVSLDLLEV
ncbi:MAG: insulinase family protein [Nitrospinae bacterium]|nr:insulinase family protein [Nitrospinota bacterium]